MPKRVPALISAWTQPSSNSPRVNSASDPLDDDPQELLANAMAEKWPTIAFKRGK